MQTLCNCSNFLPQGWPDTTPQGWPDTTLEKQHNGLFFLFPCLVENWMTLAESEMLSYSYLWTRYNIKFNGLSVTNTSQVFLWIVLLDGSLLRQTNGFLSSSAYITSTKFSTIIYTLFQCKGQQQYYQRDYHILIITSLHVDIFLFLKP